jgi:YVTN family beta-propeller protein
VNPVTNKIYVANYGSKNVTVIDGATRDTALVPADSNPLAVAVNPVTNKVYVANYNGSSVTVIDGATHDTALVPAGDGPYAVAVNPATNRIYVANSGSDNVTVIDGPTNDTALVAARDSPIAVAVNPVTNRIYVANSGTTKVTVIDGATNETTLVPAGYWPCAVAVNTVTNKIYVANSSSHNVTVIDGATNAATLVTVGSFPHAVAVNPVTNRSYFANNSTDSVVTVITDAPASDTKVRAAFDRLSGDTTSLAQPPLTGKGVNRWTPGRTAMVGVLNRVGTAQMPWDWASVTSGAGTDSITWTYNWGADSLMAGENFVCCVPLEDQAATTNNLGLGTPFAGNLEVYPVYRMGYYVGMEENPKTQTSSRKPEPTIVRGVLFLPDAVGGERLAGSAHLLDVSGRKVLDLHPGPNDVRALAPGVYFVREQDSRGQGFEDSRVTKVVVTR